jgi:diguanylate cyclase (GGDEF)-like protein
MTSLTPGGTWLCPTSLDRERLIDMNARVAVARRVQGVALGLAATLAAFDVGWWLLGLVATAGAVLGALARLSGRSRRPELISVSSIGLLELVITAAAADTGGARSPMLAWLAVPLVMLAARFPARVVGCGVAAATGCALLATAAAAALPRPPQLSSAVDLVCWAALLASLVAATVALLSAELESRGDAVIDPLTGLANRLALAGRFEQAATQAAILNAWVSVVMCDLDHFKAINDTYGHDTGDHVLRAVAYEMRRELRSFDAVYRLGGEEFLILLPGVGSDDAFTIADRLRTAIAAHPAGGVEVTMSAGVASARGTAVDPDALTRDADHALYAAKHAGRNQIHAAPTQDPASHDPPPHRNGPAAEVPLAGSV